MFNPKIYRQFDARWGKLPYPTSAYTFSGNGCGCCAVTHCAIEIEKYKNYTPADVRKYMVQFATKGYGTLWAGITAGLKHYGYESVYTPDVSVSMRSAWDRLKKGEYVGVILFRFGTKGGIRWTDGGHYVTFVDYKILGTKHYFKMKDSGGRKHDGWYCYEDTMAGLIKQVWIATRLKESYKLKVDGSWGTATTKTLQHVLKTAEDSIISGQAIKYKKSLLNCLGSSWHFEGDGFGSQVIKALQKRLIKSGCDINVDGLCGPTTIKNLQKFLKIKVTGKCDKDTVIALQKWLNNQVK